MRTVLGDDRCGTGSIVFETTIAVTALAFSASAQTRTSAHKSQLTIEQLIDIKHPSDPIWSPDGKRIAFVWDRAGVANLFVVNVDGRGQPMPLTSFTQGQIEGAFGVRETEAAALLRAFFAALR